MISWNQSHMIEMMNHSSKKWKFEHMNFRRIYFFTFSWILIFSKYEGYIIICSKFIRFQIWHFHKWRQNFNFHKFSFTSIKWKGWFQTTKNGVPPNEIDSVLLTKNSQNVFHALKVPQSKKHMTLGRKVGLYTKNR